MLTFIKLGGSLITDKKQENVFKEPILRRLAQELGAVRRARPHYQLLVGHGSGSFGHVAAKRYNTARGVQMPEEWRGFTYVGYIASELSQKVTRVLQQEGIPAMRLQPAASAISHDGVIQQMAVEPIRRSLQAGLVPLVHGDVALDDVRGGTIISTETIFLYLAQHLPVDQIILLGDVAGVYDAQGKVVSQLTPANVGAFEDALGGSAGTDVTGGMETKVRDMLALAQARPNLTVRIMSGTQSGLLQATLLGRAHPGTVIRAESLTEAVPSDPRLR